MLDGRPRILRLLLTFFFHDQTINSTYLLRIHNNFSNLVLFLRLQPLEMSRNIPRIRQVPMQLNLPRH